MKHGKNILIINLGVLFAAMLLAFIVGYFVIKSIHTISAAEEDDILPPVLTDINVVNITSTSTTIRWNTDELSDSLINFGLDKNYGIVREPRFDKTEHEIIIDNLLPNKTYFFRVTSSDIEGNQGISSDYNFTTPKDIQIDDSGQKEQYTEEMMDQIYELLNEAATEGKDPNDLSGSSDLEKALELVEKISEATKEEATKAQNKTEVINEILNDVLNKIKESSANDGDKNIDKLDDGALGELLDMLKKLSDEVIDETEIEKGKQTGDKSGGTDNMEYVSLEEVLKMVEAISSEEQLDQIKDKVQNRAEDILLPPTIILDYADIEVGIDYAIISWDTDKDSNSMAAFVGDYDFDETLEYPYTWSEGHPEELVTYHSVEVNGLDPSTIYHFQVSSKSKLGLTGRSEDRTFKTKAIAPEIYNAIIVKIEEAAATVKWSTNVPCSSIVEYTNLNNNQQKMEGNSSFLTVHSTRLTNLIFDTYYSVIINVESEAGEKTKSIPLTFITVRDKYPPKISKVSTESTIYPGSDNKIQTIANWRTDEPAICQFFYHQGLILVDEADSLPIEETYGLKHVEVITNFLPSSVYKYWIVCSDEAKNSVKSEDFTMLTPTQEESIIDIIIKNFESQFSWMKRK